MRVFTACQKLIRRGRFTVASAALLCALIAAHMTLGYLYLLKGAREKTTAELREVLRLDPENADASYKLAWVLFNQGRFDDCIAFVEQTRRAHAPPPALLVILGDAQLKKGEAVKAEES